MFSTSFPRMILTTLLTILLVSLASHTRAADAPKTDDQPSTAPSKTPNWVKPVPGFVPLQPAEHPRLLFRKSDLPALKKRAETPEGKAILARLRATLGGGEAMPTIFNPAKEAYSSDSNSSPELRKEGAYTIGHAAGFGFLYQLTGDRKYADLARQCVELALKGQRDRDDRYALVSSSDDGHLRAAPTIGTYALAYDLCYDAWPEDFRKDFANKLLTLNASSGNDLKTIALKPHHMPTSNHWGAQVGGVALTLLALNGDPGVDQKFIDQALPLNERHLLALFDKAWGDAGWFAESTGPSHVSANSAIMPALQAYKNAAGKDYTNRPAIYWMTMRWAYDLVPGPEGKPYYLCRQIFGNSSYGTDDFLGNTKGGGISHGGWFAQGFGVIPDEAKPALLWTYNNFVAKSMADDYDIRNYPHRAVLSFINWPIGVTPKNPAEVLPKARLDSVHGYASLRNQWKDESDIILSVWANTGPRGWIGRRGPGQPGANHGDMHFWAYGQKRGLGKLIGGEPQIARSNPDGSGLITNGKVMLAVDFSGQAGVEALIVTTAGNNYLGLDPRVWRISNKTTTLGERVMFLASVNKNGIHPAVQVDEANKRLIVGGQTVSLNDKGHIVFKPLEAPAPALAAKSIDANKLVTIALKKAEEEEIRTAVPRAEVILPKDAPVIEFNFESIAQEKDTQALLDSSPNSLKALVKGKPVKLEPGVTGKAVLLNGADNALVIPPNKAIDLVGKSVSISCWFKNVSSEKGLEVVLLEKNFWQGGKAPDCYSLCIDSHDTVGFNTPSSGRHLREEINWSNGEWHHLVSVFNAEAKTMELYLNGKKIGNMKNLPGSCKIGEGSAALTLGARNAAKPANFFGCLLDEVIMYSRPLTRGEVRALYERGAASLQQSTATQKAP